MRAPAVDREERPDRAKRSAKATGPAQLAPHGAPLARGAPARTWTARAHLPSGREGEEAEAETPEGGPARAAADRSSPTKRRFRRQLQTRAPAPSAPAAAPALPEDEAALLDALRGLALHSPEARQILREVQVQLDELRTLTQLRQLR